MRESISPIERRVDTKLVLMSAWIALMFLYLYCDYFSLYRPGHIEDISSGRMGAFDVSQTSLFLASLLMAIPALMVLASTLAPARAGRVANLVASAAYFLVNVGNLVGETWGYYFLFGSLELALAVLIFVVSLRWPRGGS
jgi:hypothetical protein